MEADDIVDLFAYLLLKLGMGGVGESVYYLELFYGDDKT